MISALSPKLKAKFCDDRGIAKQTGQDGDMRQSSLRLRLRMMVYDGRSNEVSDYEAEAKLGEGACRKGQTLVDRPPEGSY